VTILGSLAGEPPEPMTKEQFEIARKRIRESWNGSVTSQNASEHGRKRGSVAAVT
jgi:hypothetical protein